MEKFSASTKWDELKGSAVADNADGILDSTDSGFIDATQWLKNNNHISDEKIVGISLNVGASNGGWVGESFKPYSKTPVTVRFLLSPSIPDVGCSPVVVKEVTIRDMELNDFFALFKQFNVTLSPEGVLEGREYSIPES